MLDKIFAQQQDVPISCIECGKEIIGLGAKMVIEYIKGNPVTVDICDECARIKKERG